MNRSRVTGDLTASGLLYADIANDRVGIGSTIPGNKLSLPDSAKIGLGNAEDLTLYHDSGHSYINNALGDLVLKTTNDDIVLQSYDDIHMYVQGSSGSGAEKAIMAYGNGAVELYYNNTLRFATNSAGVTVSGNLNVQGGGITMQDTYGYYAGTGNDLSILHNATNSVIKNITGELRIQGDLVRIMNSAGSKVAVESNVDDNVELYFNNAKKFETSSAGATVTGDLDVTGTVVADKLRIDIASSGGAGSGTAEGIFLRNTSENDNNAVTIFGGADDYNAAASAINFINVDHSANYGDISFDTRGSGGYGERLRITSAGRVGIGTDDPATPLHIQSTNPTIKLTDGNQAADNKSWVISGGNTQLLRVQALNDAGTGGGSLFDFYRSGNNINEFRGMKGGATWFVVDNLNQRVGINTTTPQRYLHIVGNDGATGATLGNSDTTMVLDNTGSNGAMIEFLGSTSGAGRIFFTDNDATNRGRIEYSHNGDYLRFDSAGSERLRIDSSGRLLIGTTSNRQTRLSTNNFSPNMQLESDTVAAFSMTRWHTGTSPSRLVLQKGRGTIASPAVVADGDQTGQIVFSAWDGDTFTNTAQIRSVVDGTPGDDQMPGNLVFATNSGGTATTIRMVIKADGKIGMNVTAPTTNLQIGSTTVDSDNVITLGRRVTCSETNLPKIGHHSDNAGSSGLALCATSSSGKIHFFTGNGGNGFGASNNAERMRITSGGDVLIGTDTAGNANSQLTIADSGGGDAGITIRSGTSDWGVLYFSDATSGTAEYVGAVQYNHASDYMMFRTATLERLRITSSGHMGLGVNPSAWPTNADSKALQIGTGFAAFGRGSGDEDRGGIAVNYYTDGSANYYIGNGNANRIYMNDGNIDFQYASTNSSNAGAALTFVDALRITSAGNVDINGTPPWSVSGGDYRNLSISGQTASSSGFIWLGNGAATTNADFDLARINICNGGTIVARVCGTTDTSANDDGVLRFITKETGQTEAERLRITSGGNIIPGTNNATNIGDGTTNFNSIWASTRFRGNNNVKLVLGNSQDLVIRHDGSNNIIGSPVGGDLHIKSGTGDNDNQLIACFQHSSGGVIIGAATPTFTSPTPSLTIEKASTGSGPVISLYNGQSANTASTCEILVRQNYRDSNKIIFGRENNNNWQASAASVASYTAFHTNSGSGITERLRITSAGRVGIGSIIPQTALDVFGEVTLPVNNTLRWALGTTTKFDMYSNSGGSLIFRALGTERLRIDSSGRLGLGSGATVHAYIDVRQAIDDNPLLNLGHNDGSFYRHLGTVGPATDDGRNGGSYRYMHIRLRTVWNDASMTMFRITGYHSYNDYTESYFGCYRYNNSGYRTNPYGQVIHNQKRATLHSVYNTGASPGYLVLVLDSSSNYSGFIIEHIGAGNSYGSMMQHDLEIIDTKRDTTTNDQWP